MIETNKTREELLSLIYIEETKLMNKLQELNIWSKKDFGIIIGTINKSFYGKSSKSIINNLNLPEKTSLKLIMDRNHLDYRLKILVLLNRALEKEQKALLEIYSQDRKFEAIKDITKNISKCMREEFVIDHNGQIPITSLIKFNSSKYLKSLVIKRLQMSSTYKKEELEIIREELKKYLKSELVTTFKDNTAYGTTLGAINKGFYGCTQDDLKRYLKTNKKISDLSDEEQIRYRITALYFAKAYLKGAPLNKENIGSFYEYYLNKMEQIAIILKDEYKNTHIIKQGEGIRLVETPKNKIKKLYDLKKRLKDAARKAIVKDLKDKEKTLEEIGLSENDFVQTTFLPDEEPPEREREL